MPSSPAVRDRRDRCPGVLRPWPADDGALVRIRLVGGSIAPEALASLSALAQGWGDGDLHLTKRANLQVRGLPFDSDGRALAAPVVEAIEAIGLLPSRPHDQARNIVVSPLSGRHGGRADLRSVARDLDARIRATPGLASLPGRFLFTLDDGRGDLLDTVTDLGLVALDAETAQLRVGPEWGAVLPLQAAPAALVSLADRFLSVRGPTEEAAWHVRELATPLGAVTPSDPRVPDPSPPLPFGRVGDGLTHVKVAAGVLTPEVVARLVGATDLVLTPWNGVVTCG